MLKNGHNYCKYYKIHDEFINPSLPMTFIFCSFFVLEDNVLKTMTLVTDIHLQLLYKYNRIINTIKFAARHFLNSSADTKLFI